MCDLIDYKSMSLVSECFRRLLLVGGFLFVLHTALAAYQPVDGHDNVIEAGIGREKIIEGGIIIQVREFLEGDVRRRAEVVEGGEVIETIKRSEIFVGGQRRQPLSSSPLRFLAMLLSAQ